MRIITNVPRLKRNRNIATILFFVSLAMLIGGLILNSVAATSPVFFFVPCLIMPLALFTTLVSVRMTNEYIRVPRPEDAIGEAVKGVSKLGVLYNYLPVAPHILVTPHGIYTFHALFQSRSFTVNGDTWIDNRVKGLFGRLSVFFRGETIGKPFRIATQQADQVETLLQTALPGVDLEVQPVVVLTADKAELTVKEPSLPVGLTNAMKRPNLKQMLRDDKMREGAYVLNAAQLETIDAALRGTAANSKGLTEAEV